MDPRQAILAMSDPQLRYPRTDPSRPEQPCRFDHGLNESMFGKRVAGSVQASVQVTSPERLHLSQSRNIEAIICSAYPCVPPVVERFSYPERFASKIENGNDRYTVTGDCVVNAKKEIVSIEIC